MALPSIYCMRGDNLTGLKTTWLGLFLFISRQPNAIPRTRNGNSRARCNASHSRTQNRHLIRRHKIL